MIRGQPVCSALIQNSVESAPDVPDVGKPGDRQPLASYVQEVSPWHIEHMDLWVIQEQRRRQHRTLVVAGHDRDRNAAFGELQQRLVGPVDDEWGYLAAEKEVAAVHHEISPDPAGVIEHALEVSKEVRPAARLVHPRPNRVVEAKVATG